MLPIDPTELQPAQITAQGATMPAPSPVAYREATSCKSLRRARIADPIVGIAASHQQQCETRLSLGWAVPLQATSSRRTSGWRSAILKRVFAAPDGSRRPCSQSWRVRTETPSSAAKAV